MSTDRRARVVQPPIFAAIRRRIGEVRERGQEPVRIELDDDAWNEISPGPGGILYGPRPGLYDVPVVRSREPGWRVVVERPALT